MVLRALCTVSRIYVYLSLIRGKVSRQVDVLVCEYRTGSYYLLPPSKIRRRSWRALFLYAQLHMHARWVANPSWSRYTVHVPLCRYLTPLPKVSGCYCQDLKTARPNFAVFLLVPGLR